VVESLEYGLEKEREKLHCKLHIPRNRMKMFEGVKAAMEKGNPSK
jgi:hypothetical protein